MEREFFRRVVMLPDTTVNSQILEAVRGAPGCQLDDLAASCPDFTWNQIFLEVDALSRTGELQVTSLGHGAYRLMLPKKERKTKVAAISRPTKVRSEVIEDRAP